MPDKEGKLTSEEISQFQAEQEIEQAQSVDIVEKMFEKLNSPLIKRVEKRLGEMFLAPEEEQEEILKKIFREERAKQNNQDINL